MAYLIKDLKGDLITSGQTRAQIVRACRELELLDRETIDRLPPLPRRGRELIIAPPIASGFNPLVFSQN